MSLSPGQYSNTALAAALGRRKVSDAPSGPDSQPGRPVDRALAAAERQTLTGALERVTDRRPGMVVPEVFYTDLCADVPAVLRTLVLSQLSSNNLASAMEICTAVVRLMALRPSRRWLDSQLVLRVALLAHEIGGEDLSLLTAVRELIGAQGRWHASTLRHGGRVDAGNTEDWCLAQELTALPLTFAPMLRSIIARSIIRPDVLGARQSLVAIFVPAVCESRASDP